MGITFSCSMQARPRADMRQDGGRTARLVLPGADQVGRHSIQNGRAAGEALRQLASQQHARILPRRGEQRCAGGQAGHAARNQWQAQAAAGLQVHP